ncbi:phosphoribosylanthranilate isomerase [Anderseniella sp. Alg231-50]|uniref:phosphoribosylanthranilate isomerase n=1 Tax=Anderseniella sp. Alg231-50 TaxID=1922226 RepID=UPI000D5513D8
MSKTKIKICGLSDPAHVRAAVEAGTDYVGFMFYGPSPRNVSTQVAQGLATLARGRSKIVAVVVDAEDALIDRINAEVKPDFFQVHGSETVDRIAEIHARTGVPVIKVIKVADAADIEAASTYEEVAAMVLFDAKAPETLANALPGGNGILFDWDLLPQGGLREGFMLSGGLEADNVGEAIRVTGAPAVDVSSGVETSPGVKDAAAIVKFIEAVRQHG